MLHRRILRNSIPPEILNERERRSWAAQTIQWLGTFCSFECLQRAMMRLSELDEMFRARGTGTRLASSEVRQRGIE
jgi:hypothetical protein